MSKEGKFTLSDIVREHNSLNGLRLVVVEFILVALAAMLIAAGGLLHGRGLIGIAGIGIFVNASAVIAIAVQQIRSNDKDEGLGKMWSPTFRAKTGREHPNLSAHSLIVMASVLVPFLLVALLALQRKDA